MLRLLLYEKYVILDIFRVCGLDVPNFNQLHKGWVYPLSSLKVILSLCGGVGINLTILRVRLIICMGLEFRLLDIRE